MPFTAIGDDFLRRDQQPDPLVVRDRLRALADSLGKDVAKVNELLKKHLGNPGITLTPKTAGPRRFLEASGAFDLSVNLEVCGSYSSGGLLSLPNNAISLELLHGMPLRRRPETWQADGA